ncbi:DinB family protein [Micromonospora zhanjiangensis]|uniref:DinB family protein n=1 Tax=Micromonospora zhanjiangensis TaxID=1522057 RepID=A0ABV8KGE0_9ACTN
MTWTAPAVDRKTEPYVGDERTMLEGWLDYHRQTLLLKCAGLTAEQLKTASVEPSKLTLLGLVRHMTEVERWWFRIRIAGEQLDDLYNTDASPDGDLDDIADADAEADFATFDREVAAAREAVAGRSLDDTFVRRRPDGGSHTRNVRWAYIHMIEEYARHNGHADLIRERIDGVTGD